MKPQQGRAYRIKEVDDSLALVETKSGRVVFWVSEMSSQVNLNSDDLATVTTTFAIKADSAAA